MDTVITVLIIILLLCGGVGIFLYLKKRGAEKSVPMNEIIPRKDNNLSNTSGRNELSVSFERLSPGCVVDESSLVEITDKAVVARVVDAVPKMGQVIANAGAANGVQKAAGDLYRVILPQGQKLVKSKSLEGAFRGFARNKDGITAQANLVKDGAIKNMSTVNVANAVMGAAAIVVGQYYMTQINSQLDGINESIGQIADFQDKEYKSKVMALVAEVQTISKFRLETVENEKRVETELTKIERLEEECIQLLGQANLTLDEFAQKGETDYDEYEKLTKKADKWYQYQQILIRVLGEIGDLKYALSLGTISQEKCYALCSLYGKQSEEVTLRLQDWHSKNGDKLQIEVDDARRKRQGLDAIIHKPLTLIDEKHDYKPISVSVAQMIKRQSADSNAGQVVEEEDLFNKDVNLIVKDGKVYYLPEPDLLERAE